MKITQQQLRRLINEEMARSLSEAPGDYQRVERELREALSDAIHRISFMNVKDIVEQLLQELDPLDVTDPGSSAFVDER